MTHNLWLISNLEGFIFEIFCNLRFGSFGDKYEVPLSLPASIGNKAFLWIIKRINKCVGGTNAYEFIINMCGLSNI